MGNIYTNDDKLDPLIRRLKEVTDPKLSLLTLR